MPDNIGQFLSSNFVVGFKKWYRSVSLIQRVHHTRA